MYEFFAWTAWPMTPPKTFGTFHLLFLFLGLAVYVGLAWLLRKTNEKQNKIVLVSIGGFLFLCEVYKQLFYTYYIGNGSYQWWIFPFQLCSIPMYLCLIVPFIKKEKVQGWFYTFLSTYNLLGGFISMIEQSGLSHPYITLTLHAYIWHLSLVFVGFYLIASNRAGKHFKDILPAICIFAVLCVIAQTINIVFRQHDIKMFYISPYHSTPIAVFKQIEAKCGWFINALLYCFAQTLGACLFLWIGLNIKNWYAKILAKFKKKNS